MKLSKLAAKPTLSKYTLEDEAIIKEFGEGLDFWMYDIQPMHTFIKLAGISQDDMSKVSDVIAEIVLDENGKPFIGADQTLPTHIMISLLTFVVERLGNGFRQTSQS